METIIGSLKDLAGISDKGVRFLDERENVKRVPYSTLLASSKRFADGLLRKGVEPGDPVILVMINPESAIHAILGCMLLGCPPTPVYPPLNARAIPGFVRFVKHVAERARGRLVVAEGRPFAFLGKVPHESDTVTAVVKFESVIEDASVAEFTVREENPIAFLQFTSGSTSTPKGVLVTHSGLLSNLNMIRAASQMGTESCVVTWLPVYHDMGLIGTVLNAITLPCELIVMPPILFLKKPRLWLNLISDFKGTHTAAPNFAYGLSVRRVPDVGGLDLSSMTTFICGAEPVLPKTMETFVKHYSAAGLRGESLVPAYGLAEATLAVTFSPHLRGMIADEVDFDLLSSGRRARKGDHNIRIASCGYPMAGLSVRIANEEGQPQAERVVGEIQVAGPSITPGYVGDEEATRKSRTKDGWLRTGDLGYFADGELYPCGRVKDIIIIRGKNFHAHDLESAASEVSGIRTGNVVAFSVRSDSGDRLIIVAETRDQTRQKELASAVRGHLAETLAISPDEVVIVPAGTLPKTSSGKLKRLETRELFESNKLQEKPRSLAAWQTVIESGLGFLKGKK